MGRFYALDQLEIRGRWRAQLRTREKCFTLDYRGGSRSLGVSVGGTARRQCAVLNVGDLERQIEEGESHNAGQNINIAEVTIQRVTGFGRVIVLLF